MIAAPQEVLREIDRFIRERKWGSITLNFRNGKIENINRVESVRVNTSHHTDTTPVPSDLKPA